MRFVMRGDCAVGFGILFLSIFQTGSTSSYQWRCSQLDTDNNKYYLPDFGGRTQVLGYTWQPSVGDSTYIYNVDGNSLGCSGIVTAVEFCYTPPAINSMREVFTLLTLRQQNNATIVTKSIPIRFLPNSAECTSSKCCDIMTLMEQDQFELPTSNFLIGMTTKTSPNLPGLQFNTYASLQTGSSYQLSIGQPMINIMYTLTGAIEQSLRLMWFHITPFPETTTHTHTSAPFTTLGHSVGMTPGQPDVNNNMSAFGGIIGAVMVFIIIIITFCMVLILLMLYRRKKYWSSKDVGEVAIDNTVYDTINDLSSLDILTKSNEAYSSLPANRTEKTSSSKSNSGWVHTEANVAYASTTMEDVNDECNVTSSGLSNSKSDCVRTEANVAYASTTVENVHDECNATNSGLSEGNIDADRTINYSYVDVDPPYLTLQ